MKDNKNKVIVVMLLIILLLSPFVLHYNRVKEEVIIGYLTENYEDMETLDRMKFDAVFGAPHYAGYKSYRYYDNKFEKSGHYVSTSFGGEENVDKLNWIIDEYKNISSYKDMKDVFGQIRLIKDVGDYEFVIFDGASKESEKSGYQINTIFKRNIKDYSYEKLELETPRNFCIRDVAYYKDAVYIIGTYTNIINNETVTKMISYKIDGEDVQRRVLHKNYGYYNEKSIYTIDNILYFGYCDKTKHEMLLRVNIDNDNLVKRVEIGENTSRKMYDDYKVKSMLYYDDTLYVFCKGASNTEGSSIDVMEFDRYLNLKKYYNIEVENYDQINKTFVFEDEMYIAVEQSATHGIVYRFDNERINKLIMFGLNTQKNELFYYNFFVND